jgi:hypothetical protein
MLKGKVAVVTGSTSGVGLGIARKLAAMLNGFGDAAEIEKLRQDIASTFGIRVACSGADLAKAAAVTGRSSRRRGHSGTSTCWSTTPASSMWQRPGISGRKVGRDHRDQSHRRFSGHPCSAGANAQGYKSRSTPSLPTRSCHRTTPRQGCAARNSPRSSSPRPNSSAPSPYCFAPKKQRGSTASHSRWMVDGLHDSQAAAQMICFVARCSQSCVGSQPSVLLSVVQGRRQCASMGERWSSGR